MQQLQESRGDALPLRGVRRLRPLHHVLSEGRAPAQDEQAGPGHRRRAVLGGEQEPAPAGGEDEEHPALHRQCGALCAVSRRQLPLPVLFEDEARSHPHQAGVYFSQIFFFLVFRT